MSERSRALRAGVQALVLAADSPRPPYRVHAPRRQRYAGKKPPVPPLQLPRTPREKPQGRGKGILLPSQIQVKYYVTN